jgi:hypothetical protein
VPAGARGHNGAQLNQQAHIGHFLVSNRFRVDLGMSPRADLLGEVCSAASWGQKWVGSIEYLLPSTSVDQTF